MIWDREEMIKPGNKLNQIQFYEIEKKSKNKENNPVSESERKKMKMESDQGFFPNKDICLRLTKWICAFGLQNLPIQAESEEQYK